MVDEFLEFNLLLISSRMQFTRNVLCRYKIFEICQDFRGFINYVLLVVFSCVRFT